MTEWTLDLTSCCVINGRKPKGGKWGIWRHTTTTARCHPPIYHVASCESWHPLLHFPESKSESDFLSCFLDEPITRLTFAVSSTAARVLLDARPCYGEPQLPIPNTPYYCIIRHRHCPWCYRNRPRPHMPSSNCIDACLTAFSANASVSLFLNAVGRYSCTLFELYAHLALVILVETTLWHSPCNSSAVLLDFQL